jgi:hypothetical protein
MDCAIALCRVQRTQGGEQVRTMSNSAQETSSKNASQFPPVRLIPEYHAPAPWQSGVEARSSVDFSPPEIISRRSAALPGVHLETVQVMRYTPFEYGFRAPCHLLIAAELAERYEGETFVEGLPRSTLRDFTRKLTFVPAGHDFRGSQTPRALTRTAYIYIDPRGLSPILRCGLARSSSSHACSFTTVVFGRSLSSSSRWSRIRPGYTGDTPRRSASC